MCFNCYRQTSLPGGPELNKSEQVSNDDHQMSLAENGQGTPRSDVPEGEGPYSKVKCIMGNGHMGTASPCGQNDRQT